MVLAPTCSLLYSLFFRALSKALGRFQVPRALLRVSGHLLSFLTFSANKAPIQTIFSGLQTSVPLSHSVSLCAGYKHT